MAASCFMKLFSFDSRCSFLLCASLVTTIGCGSAVSETDADASSSSSSSAVTTEQPPGTTMMMPDPATTTPPDPSTTTGLDPSTTTSGGADESSSGSNFIPRTDAGIDPMGICVGFSNVGYIATVHSADGEGAQTQCDDTPAACGGDITGTWTFEEHCGLEGFPNFFESQCPSSTMTFVGSEVSGSRLFSEDGTFVLDRTLVMDMSLQIDSQDCFGASCEGFAAAVSGDGLELECVEDEELGCDCALQVAQVDDVMGTYETGDDGLSLTVNGESADPVDYCVANGELVIWEGLTNSTTYADTMCEVNEDCERELGDIEDTWICVNS